MATNINTSEWTNFLLSVNSKISDPSSLLKAAFMTAGFQDIMDHFENESGPMGKWDDRSLKTQLRYAIKNLSDSTYNPSNKLLSLTGSLRKSILPTNTKKLSKTSIEVFANSKYGNRHNEGVNMPKRQFMWLSSGALDKMSTIIASLAYG